MDKKEGFKKYPKILKIEKDGKIIGLDKNGRVNAEFNTNTIEYMEFSRVFNADFNQLHDLYISENENLSRYEKNKNDYDSNTPHSPIHEDNRYYNHHNLGHKFEPPNKSKKRHKKKKGFVSLLVIAVIIMSIFIIKNHYANKAYEEQNQQDAKVNKLENEINSTKQQLSQSNQAQQDSQTKIDNLQNKVNELKQRSSNYSEGDNMQEAVTQLQRAQDEKNNGNFDDVNNAIGKVNDSINTDDNRETVENFGNDVKNKTKSLSENEHVEGAKEKVSNAWHDITNLFSDSDDNND